MHIFDNKITLNILKPFCLNEKRFCLNYVNNYALTALTTIALISSKKYQKKESILHCSFKSNPSNFFPISSCLKRDSLVRLGKTIPSPTQTWNKQ